MEIAKTEVEWQARGSAPPSKGQNEGSGRHHVELARRLQAHGF